MKEVKKVFVIHSVEVIDTETGKEVKKFEQDFKPNETKIIVETIKAKEKAWKKASKEAKENETPTPVKPNYSFKVNVTERKEVRAISMEDFMNYSKIVTDETEE